MENPTARCKQIPNVTILDDSITEALYESIVFSMIKVLLLLKGRVW